MTIDTPKTVRVVAVSSAAGLVLASAGFGALYAYKVGIQHGIVLAGLSVLMALALEGVKPLAIAAGLDALRASSPLAKGARRKCEGGSALLLTLGGISVAYSLTAELSLISMSKGDLVAERQSQATLAGNAERDRKRIETELSAIGITRPSKAIQAELDGGVRRSRIAPLKAELASAERREMLEASLARQQSEPVAKVADPGSVALATYLAALGFTVPAAVIGQWLILVPVLALEIGSALAYVLVQAVSVKPDGVRAMAQEVVQPQDTGPESTKAKVKAAIVDRVSTRLVDHLKANGGRLAAGERGLAKLIGSSRGTMKRALQGLVVAGIVAAEATRNGTVIRLVS